MARDRGLPAVLFTSPYPLERITGIGRFTTELQRFLQDRGLTAAVVCPALPHGESGAWGGVQIRWNRFRDFELAGRTAFRIFSKRLSFRAVHSQQAHLQSIVACLVARILGRPAILTIHLRVPPPGNFLARAWQGLVEWMSIRSATETVAVSRSVAASYRGAVIDVIENGVDTDRFLPSPKDRERLRSRLGLDSELTFVFAGRWARAKGFDILLKALRSQRLFGRAFYLLVLGESTPDEPALLQEIVGSRGLDPRTRIIGPVERVEEYLNAGDVFILPSRFEGMPLGLLEALSVGLPAIASDIPPHRDIATRAACVWLFRSEDAEDLARAIEKVLNDGVPPDSGMKARSAAIRHFSSSRMGAAYLTLYQRLGSGLGTLSALGS